MPRPARRPAAEPAPLGPRLGAKVVDALPAVVVGAVANYVVLGDPGADQQAGAAAGATVSAAVVLLLFAWLVAFEATTGTTPGKRALGLRVQDALGQTPSVGAALRRNAWLLPAVVPVAGQVVAFVAALSVAFTLSVSPRHEGWHDRLADVTTVVREPVDGTP